MKKLVFLAFCSLLLTSCLDGLGGNSNTPEKNVEFQDVIVEKRYGIKLPSYMRKTNELNDDASLQYMNTLKETYCIIIDEPTQEFIDTFKRIDEYDDSVSVVQNYQEVQIGSFLESIKDFTISEVKKLKVQGLSSITQDGVGEVDGHKIAYSFSFIEGKETIYMIICWTLNSRKNRYKATFQKVFDSFFEVK